MKVDAKIKVAVIFEKGQVLPRWFVWEDRKYDVRSINYTWSDYQGDEKITRFAVSDGSNSYELAFNSKQISWRLHKVYSSP
ncbi:MAG: hypothetical protein KKB81_03475 [Candidatus Margulisbacteria bacterium]|nr:hypothetical protein [Candidatus Margulisiibacteriota bacterium]MBU1021026.1 hypothetical protein [Candidatus Margulisiibacteriota bacterium]MBU1729607.1 hypothetical protein [Candidatus Margulisiibacteriota bacterium]MBU1956032.1 hypothetical protein [Candidatus Margulisiibacteriota bacterium]